MNILTLKQNIEVSKANEQEKLNTKQLTVKFKYGKTHLQHFKE